MNIFFTSNCPVECAKNLDDKRVNKMCLETAQLLSTAIRLNGYTGSEAYKMTHRNHPSNVWVRTTRSNYKWLIEHFKALGEEFYKRRGKRHKSLELLPVFEKYANLIPEGDLTPFANCAANLSKGISYKHIQDTTTAYMLYLNSRWETDKLTPKWYGVTK